MKIEEYLDKNTILQIDAIEGMNKIEPHSVDLIFADPPYGHTKNIYDNVIPFEPMWEAIHRVLKPNGAVCLFGEGKFYINLSASNIEEWRHEYSWNKVLTSGFLFSGWQPLRQHENIAVFYQKKPTYNPQFTSGKPLHRKGENRNKNFVNSNYDEFKLTDDERAGSTLKYPTDILNYPIKNKDIEFYIDGLDYKNQIFEIEDFVEFKKIHPSMAIHATEKPAGLCDFIVKTYSNEGDTVLDFCCGSGSIPLAAKRNNRNYIGFDIGVCLNPKSPNFNVSWAEITKKRLEEEQSSQLKFNNIFKADKGEQTSLFAS